MPNCSTITPDQELRQLLDSGVPYHDALGAVLDKGIAGGYQTPEYVGKHRAPEHVHTLVEVGLTDECEYGCKIVACSSGDTAPVVSHRAIYGCPLG